MYIQDYEWYVVSGHYSYANVCLLCIGYFSYPALKVIAIQIMIL